MKRMSQAFLVVVVFGIITLSTTAYIYLSNTPDKFKFINLFIISAFVVLSIVAFLWHMINDERKRESLLNAEKNINGKFIIEKNRFEAMFKQSEFGVALLHLDGRVARVNKTFCELLGYAESDMALMNLFYVIHPSNLNGLQMNIQQLIDNTISVFRSEQQCIRKSDDAIWIKSTLSLIRDHLDMPINFLMLAQDITFEKKAEERLQHMAYHDPLTSLANRNKLEQFLNHILATARRHQTSFALMFLDLDRFKNINDSIGHESGDVLLQIIAKRLVSTVRSTDMVARLGGDEFVLLVTDVNKSDSVAIIAQKVLENTLKAVVINGQEVYITTSIGISLYPHDGQNMQSLMKNADLALYRAKENGRNNYQFYTLEMTTKSQQKMSLQNALAQALVRGEFLLNYQPKMNLVTRQITGIEAFLRWRNKDYQMVTTDEIIALAEETGLIVQVSEWVLYTACQQLKQWHEMGFTSLTIAINTAPRLFKQLTLVDDVLKAIQQIGLSPQSIEIEVTEKTIMEDPENTLRALYALRDIGVKITIDDFGTGYWSLGNLRRLSVDKIKIDKTFIKQVPHDETSVSITSAIIAMVNKLGIISVAEGVETREQYEFLVKEKCTEIQGYYLTRPLSDLSMAKFLKHPIPDAEVINKDEIFS